MRLMAYQSGSTAGQLNEIKSTGLDETESLRASEEVKAQQEELSKGFVEDKSGVDEEAFNKAYAMENGSPQEKLEAIKGEQGLSDAPTDQAETIAKAHNVDLGL